MDKETPAARGCESGAPAPFHQGGGVAAPLLARPPHSGREKGLFRSFLIRLKACLLGNLKKGLGNQKYNLETFQGARDGYREDLDS